MRLKQLSLFFVSLALLFFILVVYFKRAMMSGLAYGQTDFYKFYESVLFYFSGQNIYSNVIVEYKGATATAWITANANLNPPFLTFLFLPLHFFNYAKAYQLWSTISVGCILLGAYLATRPFLQWHKNTLSILALFALYLPCSEILAFGQTTSIMLVLIASAWLLAREKNDIAAGIFIGVACGLKLFCGLFLIYFLCLKRFRLFAASLLSFFATVMIGGVVFGFHAYLFYHAILKSIDWYAASLNASLYGFFVKCFSNTEKNTPVMVVPYLASVLTVLSSSGLATFLIHTWRKWGEQQFDLGFSVVIVAMLLLSPLGWVYYFPLLLIPYLVLISKGNDLVHLGACFLLLLSTLTGDYVRAVNMKTLTQVLLTGGFGFYVLVILLGLLCVIGAGKWRSQPQQQKIPGNLWILIYSLIFIPSAESLSALFKVLLSWH